MVLACDVDKPAATQPRIFARSPTLNQQRQLLALQAGRLFAKSFVLSV
jgi:hypothetical protein